MFIGLVMFNVGQFADLHVGQCEKLVLDWNESVAPKQKWFQDLCNTGNMTSLRFVARHVENSFERFFHSCVYCAYDIFNKLQKFNIKQNFSHKSWIGRKLDNNWIIVILKHDETQTSDGILFL